MSTDFRVSTDFLGHYKTKKLKKRLGLKGVFALLALWTFVAKHRPDGNLAGMSIEDIELAVDWGGKAGLFVATLEEIGFLDKEEDGQYVVHDWLEANPWVAGSTTREDKARLSRMARTMPDEYKILTQTGINGISKGDYETLKNADDRATALQRIVQRYANTMPTNGNDAQTIVERTLDDVLTNVKQTLNDVSNDVATNVNDVATPAPAPAPAPALMSTTHTDIPFCPEPSSGSSGQQTKSATQPTDPPVITLPLNTGEEHPVTQADVDHWRELYPAVDVMQALRNMRGWLEASPTRRKTKNGINRFVNTWLARAQDQGGGNTRTLFSSPPSQQQPVKSWAERESDAAMAAFLAKTGGTHG